MNFGTY